MILYLNHTAFLQKRDSKTSSVDSSKLQSLIVFAQAELELRHQESVNFFLKHLVNWHCTDQLIKVKALV